jgi:hypothetical protein
MIPASILGLSLLLVPVDTSDVIVVTVPARGDIVTLPLSPAGKVELRRDVTVSRVRIETENMKPASAFGSGLNTYIVWAVSPEGLVENIGELAVEKDKGRLETTARFEQAGILITAEPHYMVDRPSAAIAYRGQNPRSEIRRVTVSIGVGSDDYSKLQPAQSGVPGIVAQSRAAFEIAKNAEAEKWAETEFRRARIAYDTLEQMLARATPLDILAQSANETIRRSQQAALIARENADRLALQSARNEITSLRNQTQALQTQVVQLSEQQTAAASKAERLQNDIDTANREAERLGRERNQAQAQASASERQVSDFTKQQEELKNRLTLQLRDDFYDPKARALSPTGRDALSRLGGMADIVSGPIRISGPASELLFEAARRFLMDAGIPQDRIVLNR